MTPLPVADGRRSYGAYRIICLGDCMQTHHTRLQDMDAKTMATCPECDSDLVLIEKDKPVEAESGA